MGTYKLKITSVASKSGAWTVSPGGATNNAALIAAITVAGGSSIFVNGGDGLIRWGTEFFLDGSVTPTGINSLPSGFHITTAIMTLTTGVDLSAAGQNLNTVEMQYAIPEVRNISGLAPNSGFDYLFGHPTVAGGPPSALHMFSDGCGINFVRNPADGTPGFLFMEIDGEYEIQAFSWTIDTTSPVEVGQEISISGTDGLDEVSRVCIQYLTGSVLHSICINNFNVQTPTHLTFNLPSGLNATTIYIVPVTFSGSAVLLGSLTLLFEDTTGIYTFVNNKSNDTLYDGARDGTTNDVKIPDPFAKTGFIGA